MKDAYLDEMIWTHFSLNALKFQTTSISSVQNVPVINKEWGQREQRHIYTARKWF